jgi:hypothetical protein
MVAVQDHEQLSGLKLRNTGQYLCDHFRINGATYDSFDSRMRRRHPIIDVDCDDPSSVKQVKQACHEKGQASLVGSAFQDQIDVPLDDQLLDGPGIHRVLTHLVAEPPDGCRVNGMPVERCEPDPAYDRLVDQTA